ncbi:MAG TPA: endonuclease III [Firmicutes bacterium]|jgi:endonuclease-3|nr:endonuclease III [Bacillota bacterium]
MTVNGQVRQELVREQSRVQKIVQRLEAAYGRPTLTKDRDGVDELVLTILSQNTNDLNRDRAFARLRERFPSWEAVKEAPVEEIEEAIRPGGLARTKAPRIKKALAAIERERGEISLDWLAQTTTEEAAAFLTSLEGVGPKTAACVLLFAFRRPVFPVDTHIWRLAKRLGLVDEGTDAPSTQRVFEELVSPEDYFPFHLNLIRHGREVCKAQRPRCPACILGDLCKYPRKEHHHA